MDRNTSQVLSDTAALLFSLHKICCHTLGLHLIIASCAISTNHTLMLCAKQRIVRIFRLSHQNRTTYMLQ